MTLILMLPRKSDGILERRPPELSFPPSSQSALFVARQNSILTATASKRATPFLLQSAEHNDNKSTQQPHGLSKSFKLSTRICVTANGSATRGEVVLQSSSEETPENLRNRSGQNHLNDYWLERLAPNKCMARSNSTKRPLAAPYYVREKERSCLSNLRRKFFTKSDQ